MQFEQGNPLLWASHLILRSWQPTQAARTLGTLLLLELPSLVDILMRCEEQNVK